MKLFYIFFRVNDSNSELADFGNETLYIFPDLETAQRFISESPTVGRSQLPKRRLWVSIGSENKLFKELKKPANIGRKRRAVLWLGSAIAKTLVCDLRAKDAKREFRTQAKHTVLMARRFRKFRRYTNET